MYPGCFQVSPSPFFVWIFKRIDIFLYTEASFHILVSLFSSFHLIIIKKKHSAKVLRKKVDNNEIWGPFVSWDSHKISILDEASVFDEGKQLLQDQNCSTQLFHLQCQVQNHKISAEQLPSYQSCDSTQRLLQPLFGSQTQPDSDWTRCWFSAVHTTWPCLALPGPIWPSRECSGDGFDVTPLV